MIPSLPTELLRQIIESTIPHTFHSQTYDARQVTLRHLSLVSNRFREIAQPLLFEIVSVQSPEKLKTVIDTIEAKGSSAILREAICRKAMGKGIFSRGNIGRLVRSGHNLRTVALRLEGQGTELMDLSALQLLPRESINLSRETFKNLMPLVCRTQTSSTIRQQTRDHVAFHTSSTPHSQCFVLCSRRRQDSLGFRLSPLPQAFGIARHRHCDRL